MGWQERIGAGERATRRVLTPGQRVLFGLLAAAGAVLVANSLYLGGVHALEAASGRLLENEVALAMFLLHVVLGLALVVPGIAFVIAHGLRARRSGNRRAVGLGLALAATLAGVAATGIALTRIEGVIELTDPTLRLWLWVAHLVLPVAAALLYVAHRRRGRGLDRAAVRRWSAAAAAIALAVAALHAGRAARPERPPEAAERAAFFPSLVRTAGGGYLAAEALMLEGYCRQCHEQSHAAWAASAHRFSSFNNPAYRFSVLETRRVVAARDGDLAASRWCAGCHDPVPLLSGRWDDPAFDVDGDPTAMAGLTCVSCHAVTEIASVRGNADFVIEAPQHYPFALSEVPALAWASRQLVRARPRLHRATFLKPLHRTPEFCGGCHKVHLPEELNGYGFVRGQNHYDPFRLSGVSGGAAGSFYYPPRAFERCADCHMPLDPSAEFGARDFAGDGVRALHDHRFAAANTGLAALVEMEADAVERRRAFLEGTVRVDLFGLREGGELEGRLHAPLRPDLPELVAGASYLLEVVVRTLSVGHTFTQGTADSNEVWLEVTARSGAREIGASGELAADGAVDRWAHFVNAWVVDREGRRIDRRNAQDIFAVLFDHQIPPGAAVVVHYRLDLPAHLDAPVELAARLRYRKFDTTFLRHFTGEPERANDLPVVDLATDRLVLPVAGGQAVAAAAREVPAWERWNDYGIGLLGEGGPRVRGALAAARAAFAEVEGLGRPDGALNRVRVDLAEGSVGPETEAALARAAADPLAPPWVVDWLAAQVALRQGQVAEAIAAAERLAAPPTGEARARGFDFRRDDRVWELLGRARTEAAALAADPAARRAGLARAAEAYEQVLALDPEHPAAHYQLARLRRALGDAEAAREHLARFERYRQDDPAKDAARAAARRLDPVADRQAERFVIYELRPPAPDQISPGSRQGTPPR
ncbi:MAG: aspartate phosphatase [Thermoanaerobaculia bacterium]|nr:aspartate phosphatase [Thermoanaerobaculia bacterium]